MDPRTIRVVVVPHTHWDREWYRTHEQFRVRLVTLVDALLDLLERDPAFRHFMLDGQTIVVDDYLEASERAVREGWCVGALAVDPGTCPDGGWSRASADPQPAAGPPRRRWRDESAVRTVRTSASSRSSCEVGLSAAMLWRGVGADVIARFTGGPDGTGFRSST
jgi:hypothetical protein